MTFWQSKQLFLFVVVFFFVNMALCIFKFFFCVCICPCVFVLGQKKNGVCGGGVGGLPPKMVYKKREKEEKLCSQKSNDSLPKIDLSFYK